jgi:hypothetical protein
MNYLIKYRQEIDIFDINSTKHSIESTLVKILKSNEQTKADLDNFLTNINELYEWDVKNEHSGYDL